MPVELEERVDRLEALLGQFIVQTNVALTRMERGIESMNKQWGELANKMGTVVEDIVAPNIPRIAQVYFQCGDPEFFGVRVRKRHSTEKSKMREFDVIAVWEEKMIINETKSTPRMEYIHEFIEALHEVYEYFPEYRDKEMLPIFSSLYLSDDVVRYLTQQRIYAMAMKGDSMDILNYQRVSGNR